MLVALLKRLESRALILLFALAGVVWAFLEIADEMAEGETVAIDRRLLMALREPSDPTNPIGARPVEEAVRDFTALGGFTMVTVITVIAVIAFLIHKRWKHALVLAGVMICSQIANGRLKNLYDRPRPDVAPHGHYVYSFSFPSGHATAAAALYLTLAMLIASQETNRGVKILVFAVAALLTVAIGFSRVYLAVHWASDVLAGWCAGAAWALVGWAALLWLTRADRRPTAAKLS